MTALGSKGCKREPATGSNDGICSLSARLQTRSATGSRLSHFGVCSLRTWLQPVETPPVANQRLHQSFFIDANCLPKRPVRYGQSHLPVVDLTRPRGAGARAPAHPTGGDELCPSQCETTQGADINALRPLHRKLLLEITSRSCPASGHSGASGLVQSPHWRCCWCNGNTSSKGRA